MMQIDVDVLRWRFLIAGFLCLFFLIGAARFVVSKTSQYISSKQPQPWELHGKFPPGSLGAQIQDAQKRAKR